MTFIETEHLQTLDGAKNFINDLSQECRKNLTEALNLKFNEEKKNLCKEIQSRLLKKISLGNGTQDKKNIIYSTLEKYIENNDEESLQKLDSAISFTDKGGLVVHTAEQGDIIFYPKQVTFDDIKDIDGIEVNKNIWTENPATGQLGLWLRPEAIKLILNTEKKILSDDQFLAIKDTLPSSGDQAYENILFNLLGSEQYGLCDGNWTWRNNMNRCLNTVSRGNDVISVYDSTFNNGIVKGYNCAAGIRFIEN